MSAKQHLPNKLHTFNKVRPSRTFWIRDHWDMDVQPRTVNEMDQIWPPFLFLCEYSDQPREGLHQLSAFALINFWSRKLKNVCGIYLGSFKPCLADFWAGEKPEGTFKPVLRDSLGSFWAPSPCQHQWWNKVSRLQTKTMKAIWEARQATINVWVNWTLISAGNSCPFVCKTNLGAWRRALKKVRGSAWAWGQCDNR